MPNQVALVLRDFADVETEAKLDRLAVEQTDRSRKSERTWIAKRSACCGVSNSARMPSPETFATLPP